MKSINAFCLKRARYIGIGPRFMAPSVCGRRFLSHGSAAGNNIRRRYVASGGVTGGRHGCSCAFPILPLLIATVSCPPETFVHAGAVIYGVIAVELEAVGDRVEDRGTKANICTRVSVAEESA